jgi:hypothetical protein
VTRKRLTLQIHNTQLAIARLDPADPLPDWATGVPLSVTRTDQELSIVCAQQYVPADVLAERGWAWLSVAGPLKFEEIGVIASLAQPLKTANIPIFILSTYDTDYLLLKAEELERAALVLSRAGHRVTRKNKPA